MPVKRLLSMAFCAFVCLLAALPAAWTQPLGKGMISGTAVDGESGDPVRKALVTLTIEGSPKRWATARTDASGRFQFEGLPPGKYDLRATKPTEGTAIFGANSIRELGDLITLGDGETRGAITLRFLRAASISGHVYDSEGEPVADANVSLLRPGRNLGVATQVRYRGSNTDDRGEYRFPDISPGRYYLRVTPGSLGRWGLPSSGQALLVDQYYGGARDSTNAAPIHVNGGESLADLDFHLISEPAVEVRGQILGVPAETGTPQNQPAGGETFIVEGTANGPGVDVLISPAEAGSQLWSNGTGAQGPEHRFQLPDVPAGRYRIEATLRSGNKTYAASQVLDLHPGSGEIILTLAPAANIQGTLRVEGQASAKGRGFSVQLTRSGMPRGNISAQVGPDGRFTLEQIPPGEWQLVVNPVPPGFLKSEQFGDKDILLKTFAVGSGNDTPLNIVVSMRTATIHGEVDAGSADSNRAGIMLAPAGPYHTFARFYYGTPTDANGKFQLNGIAPGKYKIYALEKMAAADFRNPEAADQLDELTKGDNLVEVIDLAEGSTVEAHPKLIPAERAAKALQ
jgi:protocatechuate 3,4-dioxygenase beta subunit